MVLNNMPAYNRLTFSLTPAAFAAPPLSHCERGGKSSALYLFITYETAHLPPLYASREGD